MDSSSRCMGKGSGLQTLTSCATSKKPLIIRSLSFLTCTKIISSMGAGWEDYRGLWGIKGRGTLGSAVDCPRPTASSLPCKLWDLGSRYLSFSICKMGITVELHLGVVRIKRINLKHFKHDINRLGCSRHVVCACRYQ